MQPLVYATVNQAPLLLLAFPKILLQIIVPVSTFALETAYATTELACAPEVTVDLLAQICLPRDVWIMHHVQLVPLCQAALGVSLHWALLFAQKLQSVLHQLHVDRLLLTISLLLALITVREMEDAMEPNAFVTMVGKESTVELRVLRLDRRLELALEQELWLELSLELLLVWCCLLEEEQLPISTIECDQNH